MATPALLAAPVRAVVAAGADGETADVGTEGEVPLVNEGATPVPEAEGTKVVPAVPVGTTGTGTETEEPGTTTEDDAAAEEAGAEVKVLVRVQGQLVMVKVVASVTVKVWLPSVKVVEPGQKVV